MKRRPVAWRRELILAGLVAMDALWLTPWLALLLGSAADPSRSLPGPAILALLLLALWTARALGASPLPPPAQQLICGVVAVLSGVSIGGLVVYRQYPFHELDWLLAWAGGLGGELGAHSALLLGLALFAWWRGISLAQSRLGSDSVGACFRAGIVAWASYHVAGLGLGADHPTVWLFLYCAVGLLALGLARAEDARHERGAVRSPFAASWLLIIGGAALAVVGLAAVATLGVTLVSGYLFRWLLPPLAAALDWALTIALHLLMLALAPPLEWLIGWLHSLITPTANPLAGLQTPAPVATLVPTPAPAGTPLAVQAIAWLLLALGLVGVVALVMRGLGRRRHPDAPEPPAAADWASAPGGRRPGLSAALARLQKRLANALAPLQPGGYSLASAHEIYASLQRLAARRGVARAEAQTPYEYERRLDDAWPEAGQEVGAITNAYVRAHYGRRTVSRQELDALRRAWQRLRAEIEGHGPPPAGGGGSQG